MTSKTKDICGDIAIDATASAHSTESSARNLSPLLSSGVLLQNSSHMLYIFDNQYRLHGHSEVGSALLFSDTGTDYIGMHMMDVFAPAHDGWVERCHRKLRQVLDTLESECYEEHVFSPEGRTMSCSITISPLIEDGKCMGTIVTVMDISELIALRRSAEDATRAKIDFMANMSHEIRTPINAIKGLSELLALTSLNGMQLTYTRNIVTSTNTLLSIINDLLDFSKLDSEGIELIEGEFSLNDLITEMSNVISYRASEKGLALFWDISPRLPATLKGDDVRIKQILLQVLGNAVKFTPQGHIIFTLHGEENSASQKMDLVCIVEDTGVGIRTEELTSLFDPFYRADINTNRTISGSGLGLSICQRLAKHMGGDITVRSEYGKGSTFTVRLPLGRIDDTLLAEVVNPEQKQVLLPGLSDKMRYVAKMLEQLGISSTMVATDALGQLDYTHYSHCIFDDEDSALMRKLRARMPACLFVVIKDMRYAMNQTEDYDAVLFEPILVTELAKLVERQPSPVDIEKTIDTFALKDAQVLIVDDSEINLLVSGEILRAYKGQVTTAASGAEALQLCEGAVFDIIFMDHMMPGMDGIETATAIRNSAGPNMNTPIVALTANVISDVRSSYIACGMNDFIGKPIEMTELSRVLMQWLAPEKIVSMQSALENNVLDSESEGLPLDNAMEQLIISMDAFGMYVSDVMREINNDYAVYLNRMERIRTNLNPLVQKLRGEVAAQNWIDFARDISDLAIMIHDAGARDCSGRARKLHRAAKEDNADYIRGDFFSLMDNMYMLQKKMEVAVPIARGTLGVETPFGDKQFCLSLLEDMRTALLKHDIATVDTLMESLSCYSLDHDLDMILVEIRTCLSEHNLDLAISAHARALEHCIASLA